MSGRMAKLVLMLSSQHDGEVVAAARAIERELLKRGLDWHAFAILCEGGPAPRQEMDTASAAPPVSSITPEERGIIIGLYSLREHISAKSRSFIVNMHRRLNQYEDDTVLSPGQRKWLYDLADRYIP